MARKKNKNCQFLHIESDSMCYNRLISEHLEDDSDPYGKLANAIVCMAIDDYRYSIENNNDVLKHNIEVFFHSNWCSILTGGISPEKLIGCAYQDILRKKEAVNEHSD